MVWTGIESFVAVAKDIAQGNQTSNVFRPLGEHYVFLSHRLLEKLSDLLLAKSLKYLLLLDSLEVVSDLGDRLQRVLSDSVNSLIEVCVLEGQCLLCSVTLVAKASDDMLCFNLKALGILAFTSCCTKGLLSLQLLLEVRVSSLIRLIYCKWAFLFILEVLTAWFLGTHPQS